MYKPFQICVKRLNILRNHSLLSTFYFCSFSFEGSLTYQTHSECFFFGGGGVLPLCQLYQHQWMFLGILPKHTYISRHVEGVLCTGDVTCTTLDHSFMSYSMEDAVEITLPPYRNYWPQSRLSWWQKTQWPTTLTTVPLKPASSLQ